jgi:hypothetical protein
MWNLEVSEMGLSWIVVVRPVCANSKLALAQASWTWSVGDRDSDLILSLGEGVTEANSFHTPASVPPKQLSLTQTTQSIA